MPAPEDDLELLIEAARAAGKIALHHWRAAPRAWEKAGGAGPVTEADLAIDRMLAERLRGARPDYGWLSEETGDDGTRLAAERVFIIDPIDGTRGFIDGQGAFAHSLAVACHGQVTAAVVFLPALERLYTATLDGPALRDGAPIAASPRTALQGASILAAKASLRPEHWNGGVPKMDRRLRPSLAYRLCLVAEGHSDAMLTLRDTWEWDSAAGSLIAQAAGAVVSDRFGGALTFNAPHPQSRGLLAAPPALHEALRVRLRAR